MVSDLYDEDEAVAQALQRAAHAGHEVVVFHVLSRDEIEIPFNGDVELVDLETGRSVVSNRVASGAPVPGGVRRVSRSMAEPLRGVWD